MQVLGALAKDETQSTPPNTAKGHWYSECNVCQYDIINAQKTDQPKVPNVKSDTCIAQSSNKPGSFNIISSRAKRALIDMAQTKA